MDKLIVRLFHSALVCPHSSSTLLNHMSFEALAWFPENYLSPGKARA